MLSRHRRVLTLAGVGLLAGFLVAGSAFAVWTQLDLDGDGYTTSEEWDAGSDPALADTDGDGLDDGHEIDRGLSPVDEDSDNDSLADGWEHAQSMDPLSEDSDGDGVDDPTEVDVGSDPLSSDTDGDGLDDAYEHGTFGDCDGDGVPAILEADDDGDHRRDVEEARDERCDPDVDGDGVLDGHERNVACITRPDCDADGLDDGTEAETHFDALDADTFSANLSDSVLKSFEDNGQEPSPDGDGDGIPDAWEDSGGLISWGQLDPAAGERDLLVEFVRVEGPDSSDYHHDLDFSASYRDVEGFFEDEGNVDFHWTETTVELDSESRPPLVPSEHAEYYGNVLREARYSENPYVTTVVLNPQHDQSAVAHLGIAPIRGMLGAVDYGAHTTTTFEVAGVDVGLSPFLESAIEADRQDIVRAYGFNDGGETASGDYYVGWYVDLDRYEIRWGPFWFDGTPDLILPNGSAVPMSYEDADVNHTSYSHTIAHELGHTLGLCHTSLSSCARNLSESDQFRREESTMHPETEGTLNFLPSEWDRVHRYVACPPQRTVRSVATGASTDELLEKKYGYGLFNITDLQGRECGSFPEISHQFDPERNTTVYETPEPEPEPTVQNNTPAATRYYGAGGFVMSVLGGIGGAAAWLRRDRLLAFLL